ncbi:DUF1402 family protein [Candidatus Nomurabacteria bacterium]|nr:DUF1402 family protein [Candidatus Nomurabacteria bacterium]
MKLGISIVTTIIALYASVFFAVKFGWTNVAGLVDEVELEIRPSPIWINTEEWQTLKVALIKDKSAIEQASMATDISPRLIVAMVIPEQLRLFNDEREIFKQVFLPLKILGNQTQFSWGVAGLKPETAEQIEKNLQDKSSPFFPGEKYAHLLDFATENYGQERFSRIADEKNHYFAYLYTAIYVKEIIAQWQVAGFDISNQPEILATLFNIGFANSQPKINPQVGGSEIELGGHNYSFGRLAYEFFHSNELAMEFPQ